LRLKPGGGSWVRQAEAIRAAGPLGIICVILMGGDKVKAIEAIKGRRSIRKYRPDPVPREIIEDIVDCGRLAPSARNDQPWEFVVVTEQSIREEIAAAARFGKFIADAPVCLLAFARPTRRFVEDTSAAFENMLVAAYAHGLGTCWVAGHNTPYENEIARICKVPGDYRLVAMSPLGYPDEEGAVHKRELEEVLHWESF
jgi:nitroreductase